MSHDADASVTCGAAHHSRPAGVLSAPHTQKGFSLQKWHGCLSWRPCRGHRHMSDHHAELYKSMLMEAENTLSHDVPSLTSSVHTATGVQAELDEQRSRSRAPC